MGKHEQTSKDSQLAKRAAEVATMIVAGVTLGIGASTAVAGDRKQGFLLSDRIAPSQSVAAINEQQLAADAQQIMFDIPAQDLNTAMLAFAEKAGLQVFYNADKLRGLKTQGVQGSYTPEEALRLLLAGTGLEYRLTADNTVTLQPAAVQAGPTQLAPLVVTASRGSGALDTLSRNVTVIPRAEIEKQQETSQGVADLLSKVVPGMAPSSQTLTNFGQTLRGREVLVLIDGVPMNTNRNVSRDLFNITPSNIESIEVVHGVSSVYGGGGAGGVIYINTPKPQERRSERR